MIHESGWLFLGFVVFLKNQAAGSRLNALDAGENFFIIRTGDQQEIKLFPHVLVLSVIVRKQNPEEIAKNSSFCLLNPFHHRIRISKCLVAFLIFRVDQVLSEEIQALPEVIMIVVAAADIHIVDQIICGIPRWIEHVDIIKQKRNIRKRLIQHFASIVQTVSCDIHHGEQNNAAIPFSGNDSAIQA